MNLYSGKTLAEALASYQQAYDVKEEEIVYEVVESKAGFLGIGAKVEIRAYSYKNIIEAITNYLNNYLKHLNIEYEIDVVYENKNYKVTLNSDNNAVLIGKNGKTLLSLNTVLKNHLNTMFKRYIAVLIDIGGYKDHKYDRICRLALRTAKEVRRTKIDAALDPMPNDERKVIHQFLTDMKYVRTVSAGEAHQRHITIVYDETKK